MECYSGISGDMTVAALLDLGANKETLYRGLDSLNINGYRIEISKIIKNGIEACDFNVVTDEEREDYKINTLPERNLFDIYNIIDNSTITENAKNISKKIFKIKAEALAFVHKLNLREVFFHERGAIDSIVDIVSTAICLDDLEIEDVIVSDIYDGCGSIKCRRGIIPVPVPAVVNIASRYNLNLKTTNINGEMVTPTGASIIAAIRTKNVLTEKHEIKRIGIGAGKRVYPGDGVIRIFLY